MKKIPKMSNPTQQKVIAQRSSMGTKKIAATVAAFGAALGMNLQAVLAGPSSPAKNPVPSTSQPQSMTPSEIDRVKKLQKGSSSLPSGLQKKPDTLAFKMGDKDRLTTPPSTKAKKLTPQGLQNRPGVRSFKFKDLQPGMKSRPGVQTDKVSPSLQGRPGSKTR